MKKLFIISSLSLLLFSACKNDGWEFPDYEGGTTLYFATQYPVRTIELGNDETFDNSIDNKHKCIIYATMGGVYSNNANRTADITVTNSLCDGFQFENGGDVVPMPSAYYTLSANRIVIPKGKIMGGIEVQLTDAFFADPLSIKNTYVLPIVMSNVQNADSILSGKANVANPHRCVASDWSVAPKDYVLYAIKYINPWDAVYLRRGVDKVTEGTSVSTTTRRKQYVENDEVYKLTTLSYMKAGCSVSTTIGATTLTCDLVLTFNDNNKCTITSGTAGYTVSGSGEFVEKGEKKSFNNKDRDVLYLDYTVDFGAKQYATKDTLVVRDRQVAAETFNIIKK